MKIQKNDVLKTNINGRIYYCCPPMGGGLIRQENEKCLLYIPDLGIEIIDAEKINVLNKLNLKL